MPNIARETLFALDCGATNWRLYRVGYQVEGHTARVIGEPQPSPLTSFSDRKLPAVILLNPAGTALESFGEVAQQGLESEETRSRVRDYFKPCIGAYLEDDPLPHQKRYTHAEALQYTRMLLESVLAQLLQEKWRADSFDEQSRFAFAYPVHWRYDHEGRVFEDFKEVILDCFPESICNQVRFVAEPEGAILSLQRQGLLSGGAGVTLLVDVGGSTTDVVAGEVDPATGGLSYVGRCGGPLGGGLYDAEMAKYIADSLNVAPADLADDPLAMVSLRVFGQRLKESLSRQLLHPGELSHVPQRTITLVTRSGKVYRKLIKLDEATFGEIAGHLDDDFEKLIANGLKAMGLDDQDIGQVVLVGGGAQLFTIVRHVRQRFGDHKVVLADNPDEIVVQGIGLEYGASFVKDRPSIVFPAQSPWHAAGGEVGAPAGAGAWRLVSKEGVEFPILRGTIKVGRDRTNDIWLASSRASRFHAEIRVTDGALEVFDLGSTNGTFVNGERLAPTQPHVLRPGDEVRFADTVFTCMS